MDTVGMAIYQAVAFTTAAVMCGEYVRRHPTSFITAAVGTLGGAVAGAAWPVTFALLVIRG